ncbi:tubulointerstitial nephritis antigen-like [Diorhabda sublineata]|uniref:tubulointerstitial nephritis antigen-like n=1 Tax=Diorhabda sublineata TaxID=1163346 RepID=UPI0024E10839|nr:tubulointerstitial nephritis antigen-like [Diorhabda sublineata]
MISKLLLGCLLTSMPILILGNSLRDDDFADLRGPYCENIGCCSSRRDSCSVPIIGTLCYCDEFCNSTRVNDCCPDYWSHCRGIPFPEPAPPPLTSCKYQDRALRQNDTVQDNCNKCVCERGDLMCEQNVCIIDSNIIETINRDPENFGWTATNYSQFWGHTLDEGVQYRLGTLPPQRFVMTMNPVQRIYDPNSLPREFDSNLVWPGLITGIQDQGWCGSSWAISTAAVASDRYGIVSKGKEAVQLSAQNLISCDTQGQQSCSGGHLDRAWSFTKAYGLVDEDCFPYVARNERCTIKRRGTLEAAGCRPPVYSDRRGRYTVGPAYRLGNETDIMYEITKSGPVQATIKVYHDLFVYTGGIYKHTDLALNHKQGYHSVRIVGWGEENTYRGTIKYWKVANSWGTNWGENGYFRILRGENECEIESFVIASWPHISRRILLSNEVNII